MKNERKQIIGVVDCDTKEQIPETLEKIIKNLEPGSTFVTFKGTLAVRKDGTRFYAIESHQIIGEDAFPGDVENC